MRSRGRPRLLDEEGRGKRRDKLKPDNTDNEMK
jgi:hypothetical protein